MNLLCKGSTPLVIAAALALCVSCKSDSKEEKGKDKTSEKEAANSKPADTKPADTKPEEAKPEDDGTEEKIDPAHMEQDPNATDTVKAVDFKGKLPDDGLLEADQLKGKFHSIAGWTDKHGLHALVFSTTVSEKEDEVSSMLIADLFSREGDAWTSQRQFKASVDKCQFDTELKAQTGDWSITDLDKDGLGEVSFAWSVGCRSDVSPVTHKVLLVTFKDAEYKKYVLRGNTGIKMAGEVEGGEFKADKVFETAPKEFLAHAEMVWKNTSIETME
ncbi:MAG: hypothetical protein JKY56_26825 [Kofleriaceae bacterium]|nr:hypothetical protein [Kofleriaceae bacterium]